MSTFILILLILNNVFFFWKIEQCMLNWVFNFNCELPQKKKKKTSIVKNVLISFQLWTMFSFLFKINSFTFKYNLYHIKWIFFWIDYNVDVLIMLIKMKKILNWKLHCHFVLWIFILNFRNCLIWTRSNGGHSYYFCKFK